MNKPIVLSHYLNLLREARLAVGLWPNTDQRQLANTHRSSRGLSVRPGELYGVPSWSDSTLEPTSIRLKGPKL